MGQKHNHKKNTQVPPSSVKTRETKVRDWWMVLPWLARLLQAAAIGLSSYLLYHALTSEAISGCGAGAACDRILASPYAWWLGIPVSGLAVGIYLGLMLTSIGLSKKWTQPPRPWVGWLIVAGSTMVLGSIIWFVGIQWLELKAFCRLCCTTHALGALSVGCLLASWKHTQTIAIKELAEKHTKPGWGGMAASMAAGLAGLGLLVGGQLIFPKQLYLVQFHEGKFNFDLSKVPVLGKPGTNVVIDLFDYTCPHCRDLHHLLEQAQACYSNQFCIIALPVPLSTNCNAEVVRFIPMHAQACDYAKLGMGVFIANPKAYPEFDTWFFKQTNTPPLNLATEQAVKLVGGAKLKEAMADPKVSNLIQTGVSIFKANRAKARMTSLPQLVFGKAVQSGSMRRTNELFKLLETHLQVKAAASEPHR